jgi:hypothetical protein
MNRYTSILVVGIFVILSSDAAGDTTRRDSGMLFISPLPKDGSLITKVGFRKVYT